MQKCLVFDFGGGTLDVSVLTVRGQIISTISTNGDMHLGGADFDKALLKHCQGVIEEKYNFNEWGEKKGQRIKLRLLEACKNAK